MTNQLAYWSENKTFLYSFPNEKDERDVTFSGNPDQTLGPVYIKKTDAVMSSI